MKKWKHTLTPGLVQALWKFAGAVGKKGRNEVHLIWDMEGKYCLTKNEYNNFQKLRFFALVAKVKENGEHKVGHWLLTRRGGQFLKGAEKVCRKVYTYRNEVVGHSDEKIHVKEFYRAYPHFECVFEYEIADGDVYIPTIKQGVLV